MAKLEKIEDIQIWNIARELSKWVYKNLISKSSDKALNNQISRASGSVMDNIAEGFGRGNNKEFILFLSYSLGSA